MARQRKLHGWHSPVFPHDFPQRLERFKAASGLSWGELAVRLGTNPLRLRRWRKGVRPSAKYMLALLDLAEEMQLTHLLRGADGFLSDT